DWEWEDLTVSIILINTIKLIKLLLQFVPIIKIDKNVTYDCIDIYKQPGLDHPLLKNHTIQHAVVRSFSGQFHGVEAWFNGYNLNVAQDQASSSAIYIGSTGPNKEGNIIAAGLMTNPGLFGDGRVWKYGFWQGKDGKGCYNTACPGFVQVSSVIPIAQPFDVPPGKPVWSHRFIHQDQNTGNWWITQLGPNENNVDIGYLPKELFNLLSVGGNVAGVGGMVQGSPSGSSPPMGNGNFPNKESAMFSNIGVLSSNYEHRSLDFFPIEELVDSPKCYGLKIGKEKLFHRNHRGFFFNYGGPGGYSC
ncbi:hypothetical protein EUTSA_v10005486mg, partial [Eutrema salsugineum]